MKITKCIIPAAGFGTRFLPATKAQPKEMLTIVDTPVIQMLVEEAVAAGATDIIFVTSHTKKTLEDHFDTSFELEHLLKTKGKTKELQKIQKITEMANFILFVRVLLVAMGMRFCKPKTSSVTSLVSCFLVMI